VKAPPVKVAHVRAAYGVFYDAPFAAGLSEQGEEIVVECALVLLLPIRRAAVIRFAAGWALRCAADERPGALDLEIVGDENDLLLQLAFYGNAQSIKDNFPFRRALLGSVSGLCRARDREHQQHTGRD